MCWLTKKWQREINGLVTAWEGGTDRMRQRAGEAEEKGEIEGRGRGGRLPCARVKPAGGRMK